MADTRKSALNRRHEQLERWKESELFKTPVERDSRKIKIKFDDGCVFLAACASAEQDEVKTLLDKGAKINTANIDGLTALHQAVIDENLEMAEFLIENGADIEMQDNEGWTALHAAASCGFAEVVKFLLESGANIAAVNNEGELPVDLAEEDEIQEMLEEEIDKQGIDVEEARNGEEHKMLADANQWINSKVIKEKKHDKSGATALHVAAAKGYIKVMNLLIQAGVNLNAQDNDGWSPLHAAAHWGQKEASEVLVENMADVAHKNSLGGTCFDVADEDMLKWLEELKKKQASIQKDDKPAAPRIGRAPPPLKRRSSVSRINVNKKELLMHQDMSSERKRLEEKIHGKDDPKKPVNNIDKVREVEQIIKDKKETSSDDSDDDKSKPSVTTPSRKEAPSFTPKPLVKQESEKKDEQPSWRQARKTSSSESNRSEERIPRSASTPQMSTGDRKKADETRTSDSESGPSYMTPSTEDTESETQRRSRARRERATRRSTQGVTAEDLENAETLVGQKDKDTNRRAEERETTGYSRRSRLREEDEDTNRRAEERETSGYSRRSRLREEDEVRSRPSSGYSSRYSSTTPSTTTTTPSRLSGTYGSGTSSYSRPSSTSSYRSSTGSSYTPSYRRY